MKKINLITRITLLLLSVIITINLAGQNIILNPGFELGTIVTNSDQVDHATGWNRNCGTNYSSTNSNGIPGSPDLFDRNATHTCYDFTNKWGIISERTGQNRYVGFSGASTVYGVQYYGETVEGTLTQALAPCTYTVSFYAAAIQGQDYYCNGSITAQTPDPTYNKVEVVLRKNNNCTAGKVVYTSPDITAKTWTNYGGSFSLTSADVAAGYDRIEFRMTPIPEGYKGLILNNYSHIIFMDDVSLTQNPVTISSDFGLTGSIPAGNTTTYIVTATVSGARIDGYWWEVGEIDNNGNYISGTVITNPSNWWATNLYNTNTFPGYCCNSTVTTGNGTFYQGHTYRITRGTWGPCTPWTSTSKIIKMCTGCRTDGVPVLEVKDDPAYTVDIHTETRAKTFSELNWNDKITNDIEESFVYPNPSHNIFHIDLSKINNTISIEVYDNTGKLVIVKKQLLRNEVIDLSNFSKGIYLIKVITTGKPLLKKVLLQ